MVTSLVKQLLFEAIQSEADVGALLRKSKVVASQLGAQHALDWINKELNGYNEDSFEDLPSYRRARGEWKFFNPFHGWCPIIYQGDEADWITNAPIRDPISSLNAIVQNSKDGTLPLGVGPKLENAIRQSMADSSLLGQVDVKFFIPRQTVYRIVDSVRNLVLDWITELSAKGIIDADLEFSESKIEKGASVSNNYFIQNLGVLGNVTDNANVDNHQEANLTVQPEKVKQLCAQILSSANSLPPESKEDILLLTEKIHTEIEKPDVNEPKLRSLLRSLKAAGEAATGNLLAQGIVTSVASLLG